VLGVAGAVDGGVAGGVAAGAVAAEGVVGALLVVGAGMVPKYHMPAATRMIMATTITIALVSIGGSPFFKTPKFRSPRA